jgi:hypothetical protein
MKNPAGSKKLRQDSFYHKTYFAKSPAAFTRTRVAFPGR